MGNVGKYTVYLTSHLQDRLQDLFRRWMFDASLREAWGCLVSFWGVSIMGFFGVGRMDMYLSTCIVFFCVYVFLLFSIRYMCMYVYTNLCIDICIHTYLYIYIYTLKFQSLHLFLLLMIVQPRVLVLGIFYLLGFYLATNCPLWGNQKMQIYGKF